MPVHANPDYLAAVVWTAFDVGLFVIFLLPFAFTGVALLRWFFTLGD